MNKNKVSWIACPRCIGGNMYFDNDGKYVCVQCGCEAYPEFTVKSNKPEDMPTGVPSVQEDNTKNKLPHEDNSKKE